MSRGAKMAAEENSSVEVRLPVDERLALLERGMRRWRLATLSFGAVSGLLLMVQINGWVRTPAVLRAHQFEVVDAAGRPMVALEHSEVGGVIRTRNADGQPLFLVAADGQGKGTVTTSNGQGQDIVYIGSTSTGGAIALLNNMGRDVVNLQSSKSNCGLVLAKDYDGYARESLTGKSRF